MAEVIVYPAYDTFISASAPDTFYGSETGLRVGDQVSTASAAHTLLWFYIKDSVPAGARIDSAVLSLHLASKDWYLETSATSTIRLIDRVWDPYTVTWNDASDGVPWGTPGASGVDDIAAATMVAWSRQSSDAVGWYTFGGGGELVAYVQSLLDMGTPKPGLRISGAAPGVASHHNAHHYNSMEGGDPSLRPFLTINYTPDSYPSVTTGDLSVRGALTATVAAEVTADGGAGITSRGVCYGTTANPTTAGSKVVVAGGVSAFTADITGLSDGTTYHYRAYATNAVGTSYGTDKTFTTLNITSVAGAGGVGIESSISGTAVGYAGGGGGSVHRADGTPGVGTHGAGDGFASSNGEAGTAYTGGGGGGGGLNKVGGAGGKGIVIVRYLTADAISATPKLSEATFRPSLAYRGGRLFAPYAVSGDAKSMAITANSLANPTVVTVAGHLLENGQAVYISGSNSTPSIDGSHIITYINANTFSVPVNVTVAGTSGTLTYNHNVGLARTGEGYAPIGWLTQSKTTFHTGSMKKDYRYVSVSHDALPAGSTLRPLSWLIDGVYGSANPEVYSAHETRYTVDKQGYLIETTLGMEPDASASSAPIVRGINVVWNFIKNPKHIYNLDCRAGAANGRWRDNAEDAIRFLFETAEKEAVFEDRFTGPYSGAIESVEYTQSAQSLTEGPSGLVKLTVREAT